MSERSSHPARFALVIALVAAGLAAPLPAAVPAGFTDTLVTAIGAPDRHRLHPRRPAAHHHPGGDAQDLPGRRAPGDAGPEPRLAGRPHLHRVGARPPGRRRRPVLREHQPRLPLLHLPEARGRLRQPRLPLHPAARQRHRPGDRAGADRQHAVDRRQPQRRRRALRQGRVPLRLDRRRRLRLHRRRLRRRQRRGARRARADRQGPAHHQGRQHPRRQPVPGRGHGALQRHRQHHARHPLPGDLRLGLAQPVPPRLRPQHRRHHPLLRQRRRPGRLGGDRPRPRPAPTTAGTAARGRTSTTPAAPARRRPPAWSIRSSSTNTA